MFTFTITPDDGDKFQVVAGSRDVLAWEKTGKGRTFQQLTENLAMGELYRLAHIAARRLGLFTGDLRDFEQGCELATEEADDEPDPTPPAH